MKDNIYIATMNYAHENIGKGVKQEDVKQYLESQGFRIQDQREKTKFNKVFDFIFESLELANKSKKEMFFSMSGEAFFKFLEYQELKEARQASRKATKLASLALLLSFISTATSIYISIHCS